MPIYEYECEKCGLRFEELKSRKEDTTVIPCLNCNESAHRIVSGFAMSVSGGTSNETVDMTIGREANKRWQHYHDRQSERRGGKELQSFDLPKTKDGKYMPVMGLGNTETIKTRKEYVNALQEHRKDREKKGISQFSEKGAF